MSKQLGAAAQLRFALRLTHRFVRSRETARSALIVLLAALFLMGMFVTLKTLSLSGAQVADRDLGRFNASVGYGSIVLPPGDDTFVQEVRDRAAAVGATDAAVVLSATDVQLTTTPARDVTMFEADWQSDPYPAKYRLLSGRWPARPGEVVVTEPQDVAASPGAVLPVLGGAVKLQVVGTADDRYASTTNLLVGPGTWAGLNPKLTDGFALLGAQPFLLWSSGDAGAVVEAFASVVQQRTNGGRQNTGVDPDVVTTSLMTRQDLLVRPERTWIERTPAGYTVPSLLLPIGAVLLVFALHNRRSRRTASALISVGVRPITAVTGVALSTTAWCLAAGAIGTVAGVGVGVGARAIVAQLRDRPAGPVDGLAGPALQLLALIALTSLCAWGAQLYDTRRPAPSTPCQSRARATAWGSRIRDARHLLAVAAWCASAIYAIQIDSPAKAMILTGIMTFAVLLVIPEIVGLLLRVHPQRNPRLRLACRQLAADPRRAAATIAVLTTLLGASLGSFALLSTIVRTLDVQQYPDVLPGQVLLADRASITFPPTVALLSAANASGALGGKPRIPIGYAYTIDADGSITRAATRDEQIGYLLTVDTPTQVEELVGHSLDSTQTAALIGGGLLIWADAPDPPGKSSRTRLAITAGDGIVGRTPDLPTSEVNVDLADWRVGTDGVLLRATAQNLGLPLKDGPIMLTGLTDEQAQNLQKAVGRAGIDARTVRIYVPPPPPVPPIALAAAATGLAILALAAVLAATRAQARILRSYLARLLAIGIPPTWARHVLLYQQGLLLAVSTLLGLLIALIPTIVLAVRIPGFIVSIPWSQLLILLAAIYIATLLAALRSVLSLRAREGTGVGI
ncbi:hypothetical protein [Micromonospora sp. HK10]|uniref:hypothetical protein n=1 Tax=Micromonospora sp. HK10 TaxID=1538294 RepID=UPI0006272FC2|nr:hypothetical protein [Micromonospora sp. HK10]KKK07014.1 hypothetical protein LQ51_04975 [Micromonospora sp. HK10]